MTHDINHDMDFPGFATKKPDPIHTLSITLSEYETVSQKPDIAL